jgi:hypothetical protein
MITVQALRSDIPGVRPPALEPGQIAFNFPDRLIFIGDGTDVKRDENGEVSPAPLGKGWFTASIQFDLYLRNPEKYSAAPADGDVLTYDSSIEKPVWSDSIGSLANLQTTDKSSIVNAINELYNMLNP